MVNNNMLNNNDNVFTITIVRDETGDQCDHSNITQLTVTPDNGRVGNCQWLINQCYLLLLLPGNEQLW